jgi:hypothetical protein
MFKSGQQFNISEEERLLFGMTGLRPERGWQHLETSGLVASGGGEVR